MCFRAPVLRLRRVSEKPNSKWPVFPLTLPLVTVPANRYGFFVQETLQRKRPELSFLHLLVRKAVSFVRPRPP